MKHKVLAYITRLNQGKTQLLVFTHGDSPAAGVQVPAGTVELGEQVETALFREIREESGLTGLRLVCQLAEDAELEWDQVRHVFHLTAPDDGPAGWTHIVHGNGEDAGMAFEYAWVDLGAAEGTLAGAQGKWLSLIRGSSCARETPDLYCVPRRHSHLEQEMES